MKRIIGLSLVLLLTFGLFAGCQKKATNTTDNSTSSQTGIEKNEDNASSSQADIQKPELPVIMVGATPSPHAEILEVARPILEAKGYALQIMEFTDYVLPNMAVDSKELDANFFQHQPYLDKFNEENGTTMISLVGVHYEPMGIYAGKTKSIKDLQEGAQITVPNDGTNEARALLLLESQGLITIDPNAGFNATVKDITENPLNLKILEIAAEQLALSLPDVDLAVINGNFALQAGLNVTTDSLAKEEPDSLGGRTYINILAVRDGDQDREDLKALAEALASNEVKKFIEEKYQGAVVSVL